MNWYYIDGPLRVGPLNETEWAELVRSGKIQPETLVWHVGMDDRWLPFAQLPPEAAPEPPEEPQDEEMPETESPEAFAARMAAQDYQVPIRLCLSRAWRVFKSRFWLLVGATLLVAAILITASVMPVLEYLVPMLFHGVLIGGLYLIYLRVMRGEAVDLADIFAGFQPPLFKQLALQTLISSLVWQVSFIPTLLAMKALGVDPEKAANAFSHGVFDSITDPQTAMVLLLVLMTCSIPAVYFTFCWMFSIPLIVDKGLSFWPAMQLSRRKVLQHPWRIGVLSVAAGVMAASGLLLLGIGFLFTVPLYSLAMLHLYEEMFAPKAAERRPF
jgi:uncharacterized membrane protein